MTWGVTANKEIKKLNHLLTPQIAQWLLQDGYIALFVLLALGIICFPIPEETLMILSGYLIANGKLPLIPTVIAAYSGSICGITVSYLLGLTAGSYLLKRYGYLIGINESKINKVHDWFSRVGKWALFIGYFIMGIRHFTGYVAGISSLRYRTFALFAYTGAVFWASTFLSLGYFFSGQLDMLFQKFMDYDILFLLIVIVLFLLSILWYSFRRR